MQPRVAVGRVVLARDDARQRVQPALAAADLVAAVRAREAGGRGGAPRAAGALVVVVVGDERVFLGRGGIDDGGGIVFGGCRGTAATLGVMVTVLAGAAAGVDGVVVSALADEDEVSDAKVAGESYC